MQGPVFISYSSKDLKLACSVQRVIEGLGFEVWRDERRVERDWSSDVAHGLARSRLVCLLWSRNAQQSKWVQNEWITARALEIPVVPFFLPRAPEIAGPLFNLPGVKTEPKIDRNVVRTRLGAALDKPPAYDFSIRPGNVSLPFAPNPAFTGRQDDLIELYLKVLGNLNATGFKGVGCVGLGGIGKTQLCAEFVYRFAFAFERVWWPKASRGGAWQDRFVQWARNDLCLRVDRPSDAAYLEALAKYCREHPSTLVVMDNVEDPNDLNDERTLSGFAPLGLGCSILFTTRRQFDIAGVRSHNVGILSDEAAYKLLTSRRSPPGPAEAAEARAICSAVGNLPLALVLAAAYLHRYSEVAFSAYRRMLANARLDTLDVQRLSPARLATRHEAAVAVTLSSQWKRLRSQRARHVFRLLGMFPEGVAVPLGRISLFAGLENKAGSPRRLLDDACFGLRDASLAEGVDGETALRMHPLVHAFAQGVVKNATTFRHEAALTVDAALKNIARLEHEYATRGLADVLEDLATATEWLAARRSPAANRLGVLRKVLDRESHNLYTSDHKVEPALFLQQIMNRSAHWEYRGLAKNVGSALKANGVACLKQLWRTERASVALDRTLAARQDWVNAAAFADRGLRVIAATQASTYGVQDAWIMMWDLATGRELTSIPVTPHITRLVVAADGQRFITASRGSTEVNVWDVRTGRVLGALKGHTGEVTVLSVMPGGQHIISGGHDGQIRFWVLESMTGRLLATFDAGIAAIAGTPDGRAVIAATWGPPGELRPTLLHRIDVESGQTFSSEAVHRFGVDSVAVRPDGRQVLSASRDGTVRAWDPDNWNILGEIPCKASAVRYLKDGRQAIAAGDDCVVSVLDTDNYREIRRLEAHYGIIRDLDVSADGRTVISAGADGVARVWDLGARRRVEPAKGHAQAVSTVAISRDGRIGVSGSHDGSLALWNLDTGALLESFRGLGTRSDAVYIPGLHAFVTASSERDGGDVRLLDVKTRREQKIGSSRGSICLVAFEPQTGSVVYCHDSLAVWDRDGHHPLPQVGPPYADAAAISADGRYAVTLQMQTSSFPGNHLPIVWDLRMRRAISEYPGMIERIGAVAIAPGRPLVFLGDRTGRVRTWEPGAKTLPELGRHAKEVLVLRLIRDGTWAISAAADGSIKVWNVRERALLFELLGHRAEVRDLRVDEKQRLLFSASEDRTIRVWDLDRRQQIAKAALDNEVWDIAATPDGTTLIAGDRAGDTYCFKLTSPAATARKAGTAYFGR